MVRNNLTPRLANVQEQLIHLLKRKVLGRVDAKVHKEDANGAEHQPNVEHLRLEIAVLRISHVRRDKCNYEIEKPIRSSRNGQAPGADFERKHLEDWLLAR